MSEIKLMYFVRPTSTFFTPFAHIF